MTNRVADHHYELWAQLHVDVSTRLERVLDTMTEATSLGIAWSTGTSEAAEALRRLKSDLVSVRQLELRMPIVAPMKSGKSTIVNAIVGYNLLPARAEAMTTVPTKIILVEGLTEPELSISEQDAAIFSKLMLDLREPVRASFDGLADMYAHLESLLAQLRDGKLRGVPQAWRGREAVLAGLTQLNDLLRLAAILRPEDDLIGSMLELPILRTPFWMRPELIGTEGAGTLAIIDTPGPDERGVAARLVGAVESQLKNSHVVLLLLDYTAMGREADEKIRMLTEPVVQQIGRKALYVVVNKVDQRRKGDGDADAVRRFVQRDLGLVDEGADQRIFETMGQQALAAARVLSQYPRSGETASLQDTPEVRAFLEELFKDKMDQQDSFARWTEGYLLTRAERTWRDSGLPELLAHAIGRLRTSAVPVVLTSALNKAEPQLVSLRDVARLRLQATRADRQRLESELKSLEQESRLLAKVRSEAPNASELGNQIESQLSAKLSSFHEVGQRAIEGLDEDFWDEHSAPDRSRQRSLGEIEFDSPEEATEFIQEKTALMQDRLQRLAGATRADLNKTIIKLATKVVDEQDRKVRPIVERASRRLSEAFDLTLTVPSLQLSEDDIEVETPEPLLEETTEKRMQMRQEKRRRWYTLWLLPTIVMTPEVRSIVTRKYLVKIESIKEQLSDKFDSRVAEFGEQIKRYTVDHLTGELERYFAGVDAYFVRYTQSLEQARADKTRDEVGKAEIAQRLGILVDEAEDHLEAAAALRARLSG